MFPWELSQVFKDRSRTLKKRHQVAAIATCGTYQVAAHMNAAVAAARQQAAMRRPLMQPMMLQPPMRVGVPVSMPPVMGVLPVMPQFNLMRPMQPGMQGMLLPGGMMQMGAMFPGGMPGLSMQSVMQPRYR